MNYSFFRIRYHEIRYLPQTVVDLLSAPDPDPEPHARENAHLQLPAVTLVNQSDKFPALAELTLLGHGARAACRPSTRKLNQREWRKDH